MGYKILIIDDDRDSPLLFSHELKKIAPTAEIESAENGYQGLNKLNDLLPQVPDFIFIDIWMPILNGHDVVREIRKRKEFSTIPVAMYSAMGEIGESKRAVQSGASYYFQKPLTVLQIQGMIKTVLEKSTNRFDMLLF